MAISTYPASSSGGPAGDAWTLITSSSPTGTSAYTGSISTPYKKIRLVLKGTSMNSNTTWSVQVNSAAATYTAVIGGTGFTYGMNTIDLCGTASQGAVDAELVFTNADGSTPKEFSGWSTKAGHIKGAVYSNAAISSISVLNPGNTWTGGTIYIYGAN